MPFNLIRGEQLNVKGGWVTHTSQSHMRCKPRVNLVGYTDSDFYWLLQFLLLMLSV